MEAERAALLAGAEVAVILALVVAVAWITSRAILKVSTLAPPAMVIVALSILTSVSLIGFAVTQSEVLGSIAATGVGALAGSVTAIFTERQNQRERSSEKKTPRSRSDPDDEEDEDPSESLPRN